MNHVPHFVSCSVFPLLFCCLCVFSVPDRYKQKHNSKKAEEGIWTCRHLVPLDAPRLRASSLENGCLNANPFQRSHASNAASGAPEVQAVALHDISATLCPKARFLRGMQTNDASAAASADGCMFVTPSRALAWPPFCSRCRSGSEKEFHLDPSYMRFDSRNL